MSINLFVSQIIVSVCLGEGTEIFAWLVNGSLKFLECLVCGDLQLVY